MREITILRSRDRDSRVRCRSTACRSIGNRAVIGFAGTALEFHRAGRRSR